MTCRGPENKRFRWWIDSTKQTLIHWQGNVWGFFCSLVALCLNLPLHNFVCVWGEGGVFGLLQENTFQFSDGRTCWWQSLNNSCSMRKWFNTSQRTPCTVVLNICHPSVLDGGGTVGQVLNYLKEIKTIRESTCNQQGAVFIVNVYTRLRVFMIILCCRTTNPFSWYLLTINQKC